MRSPANSADEEEKARAQGPFAADGRWSYSRHHCLSNQTSLFDTGKGSRASMTKTIADVAVIMGSQSDWETMRHAAETLEALQISHDVRIVSAHRTPDRLYDFAKSAKAEGFKVIIAGAGGAAHLPGMTAAMTPLPVFGVPVQSHALSGQDSLLSIVQMPAGIPVGTLAIGKAGATHAALLAAAVLALHEPALADRLDAYRAAQSEKVAERPVDGQ